MTERQLGELDLQSLQPIINQWIPHHPTPKQAAFLLLPHREAFYGGAAGGGKSDGLLMAALQYVNTPGYAAILFRKTYGDLSLPGALMSRSHEWLDGSSARWSEVDKKWTFPSNATLSFGYLEYERQKYRYQSAEFQYIGFDELTQFTETQYLYLMSRLRRLEGFPVQLRTRSASNPGGVGHRWVKKRFVDPGSPDTPFISARVQDNPHLDQSEYLATLDMLDPLTRRQLKLGDWEAVSVGMMFSREWFNIVDRLPTRLRLCRWWDYAATEPETGQDPDWTCGVLMGRSPDGMFWILDVIRFQASSAVTRRKIIQTAQIDRSVWGNAVEIRMEQEPGASGKTLIDDYKQYLAGYLFQGKRSSGSKELRARPLSAGIEDGRVLLMRGTWNENFIEECIVFPLAGVHDDQVDAASGAYSELALNMGFEDMAMMVDVSEMAPTPFRGLRELRPWRLNRGEDG